MTALLLFGGFFLLIICGIPIAASMGLATAMAIMSEGLKMTAFSNLMYAAIGKNVLLAIPYFILTGVLMEYAGISKRLIRLATVCVGHIQGGLAIVVIIVACFFAAISGSGPATVAALGGTLIPAMEKNGYDKNMAAALVASAGGIGVIIPPSIAFVIFAMLAEISVGKLFICGIIPGIFLGICYAIAALWSIRKDKNLRAVEKCSSKERWIAFKDAIWGLFTPVIILGGIYSGLFTPTEAAGVSVVYALFVGVFIYKEIKWKDLGKMFLSAAMTSSVVMYIMGCAGVLAWILTTSGVAADLSAAMMSVTNNKYLILLLINILFLIAGCFIEANSAFCIFLPILLPIMTSIGYDRYAFGIFMVSSFAVGMVTPPVGANLYVACNIANLSMENICKKVIPFVVAGILAVLVMTYFPQISLFLPDLLGMYQRKAAHIPCAAFHIQPSGQIGLSLPALPSGWLSDTVFKLFRLFFLWIFPGRRADSQRSSPHTQLAYSLWVPEPLLTLYSQNVCSRQAIHWILQCVRAEETSDISICPAARVAIRN